MYYNTVNNLRGIIIQPSSWKIDEMGGHFEVCFAYVPVDEKNPWMSIQTTRGETKKYRSIYAAVADIIRVSPGAMVRLPYLL